MYTRHILVRSNDSIVENDINKAIENLQKQEGREPCSVSVLQDSYDYRSDASVNGWAILMVVFKGNDPKLKPKEKPGESTMVEFYDFGEKPLFGMKYKEIENQVSVNIEILNTKKDEWIRAYPIRVSGSSDAVTAFFKIIEQKTASKNHPE